VDEISTCEEHRKFPTGQLHVRDQRTGEWITLRPPDDKPSAKSWVVIKEELGSLTGARPHRVREAAGRMLRAVEIDCYVETPSQSR
jgi:hypothetical protein